MAAKNDLPIQRLVCLLIYSQADLQMYPTRESFAHIVNESFKARNLALKQRVWSMEAHKDGGKHCHMGLKSLK